MADKPTQMESLARPRLVFGGKMPTRNEVRQVMDYFRNRPTPDHVVRRYFPEGYKPTQSELQMRREELNESWLREWFARKIVLPLAKKTYGDGLLAAIVPGSVQLRVRRASARPKKGKTIKSDLDVTLILKDNLPDHTRSFGVYDLERELKNYHSETRDKFPIYISTHSPKSLKKEERERANGEHGGLEPFQIIHGGGALDGFMGRGYAAGVGRRMMPMKGKYLLK